MPRYTIVEERLHQHPAGARWFGRSEKWIDAPNPEEAIAIYATRHGAPVETFGPSGSRALMHVYRLDTLTDLHVEVYNWEEENAI